MPVTICPNCHQQFGYQDVPGALIACVCGHAFRPAICLGTSEPFKQKPPPREPFAFDDEVEYDFPEPSRGPGLNVFLSLMIVSGSFGIIFLLWAITRKPEAVAKVPEKPQPAIVTNPTVREKPIAQKPKPIVQQPKPTEPVIVFEKEPADPFDALEDKLTAAGLTITRRAANAPGRLIHDAQIRVAIVVISERQEQTEAFFRAEKKTGWTTLIHGQFVFTGDKTLMDRIAKAIRGN